MKYLFVLLLLPPFFTYSQDTTRVPGKYEKFSLPAGKIYKTEAKEIKKIKDLTVSLVRTTEMETQKSITAVQVVQKNTSLFTSIDAGLLYVDMDELPGFTNALKYCQQQSKSGKPQQPTSFMYVTGNNVQLLCYYAENSGGWILTISPRYTSRPVASVLIKGNDIDELANAFSTAGSMTF